MTVTGPNLRSIDDQVTIFEARLSPQAGKIRARVRLGKPLTPDHLAAENLGQMKALLVFVTSGDDGRAGGVQRDEAQVIVRSVGARILLVPDQLARKRQPQAAIFDGPGYSRPDALEL